MTVLLQVTFCWLPLAASRREAKEFSGAIFFNWKELANVPIYQKLVLINQMVYANEALRYVLTPQVDSMRIGFSSAGLIVSILVLG